MSEAQIKELCKRYENGESSMKLAKDFSVNNNIIRQIIHINDVSISHMKYNKKYNRQFFDEINTEEKAYWLGFLQGDGYVSKDNRLQIGLAGKDSIHLEKFLNTLMFLFM